MRHRHAPHWHRHHRHDFRLHRRLFWWFGATTLMACAVSFGVMHLTSPEAHAIRKDLARMQAFAAGRFARVWEDPAGRHELSTAVAEAFSAGVRLEDAQGRFVEQTGQSCSERESFQIPITDGGRRLGTLRGCVHGHRPGWGGVLATLFAGFLTIWAATAKLARHLTRPLQDLTRVTREIGEGKLESRVRLNYMHRGEVGILAESINEMAKRIERQLKDQRELLAGVSHEIRSPLARLRVLAELLQGGTEAPDLHAKIEREVAEIDDLVGKLLASSRLDFGALDLQPLCARDLALRALERAGLPGELLEDRSHDASVRADATLLSRALGNLLENAQHHAGGVTVLRLRADDAEVCFDVEDAGPGLSADALAHGFDPFFRGQSDGQSASRGTLGLGLALVRRIAHAHQGDAQIENRSSGTGAVATLRIPRHRGSPGVSADDVARVN